MQLGQDDLNDAALSNALNNMARKVYDAGDFDIDMMAEAEAMEKKAEAYAKYNNAAITEMIIKQLPAIAKEVAAPIASIDKVTVIDSGSGESGVSSVGGYTPAVMAKVIQAVKETTGFDLMEVMKAQTYDAKVTKNINVTGLEAETAKKIVDSVNNDIEE